MAVYRRVSGSTSLLKLSMVVQLTTDLGRLFQRQMVSGKKDRWYHWVLAKGTR